MNMSWRNMMYVCIMNRCCYDDAMCIVKYVMVLWWLHGWWCVLTSSGKVLFMLLRIMHSWHILGHWFGDVVRIECIFMSVLVPSGNQSKRGDLWRKDDSVISEVWYHMHESMMLHCILCDIAWLLIEWCWWCCDLSDVWWWMLIDDIIIYYLCIGNGKVWVYMWSMMNMWNPWWLFL